MFTFLKTNSEYTMHYLSKSDFKVARTCHTKLYYKKSGFPSNLEDDEYMDYLARGGYQVGKMATLFFPEGIEINTGNNHREAIKLTEEYLLRDEITLFEAAIESKGKLIRVDILRKKGEQIDIIEVKSKSYDSDYELNDRENNLDEYIEDVAFQFFVVKEKFPLAKITTYLYLPDKAKRTSSEGLNQLLKVTKTDNPGSKFRIFNVKVAEEKIPEILRNDILTMLNVTTPVLMIQEMVQRETEILLPSLKPEPTRIETELDKDCFKCEFCLKDENHDKSGFDICWAGKTIPENPVYDLCYAGVIGGWKKPVVNHLIQLNKLSMFDVPLDILSGARGKRQLIQIQNTANNNEWFADELKLVMKNISYPVHFIDFETAIHALPMHQNMRPYEIVAFQWSCHTINQPGEDPVHYEWLNLEPEFPNFKFAESLMDLIGYTGTPLMWSPYENTILKKIYEQMEVYGYKNVRLKNWLEKIVRLKDDSEGRFVDMNRLCLDGYFHPLMKGKTSIKWVLPAVLSQVKEGKIAGWLKNFEAGLNLYSPDEKGRPVNPYKLLPKVDIFEKGEAVKDGTGAMLAYGEMITGVTDGNEELKTAYSTALRRYCKLDTLAMAIIWEYWRSKE